MKVNSLARDFGVAMYINKQLQMLELTGNPVYKLTTEKLQPVLTNVLIRSLLFT